MTMPITLTAYDPNRPPMDLIPPWPMDQIAWAFGEGAGREGREPYSWLGKTKVMPEIAAALRHIYKWIMREDADPKTGIPHLAYAIARLMMVMTLCTLKKSVDDRPKAI